MLTKPVQIGSVPTRLPNPKLQHHEGVVTIASLATGEVLIRLHKGDTGPRPDVGTIEFSPDGQQILWTIYEGDGIYLCDDIGQGHVRSIGAGHGRPGTKKYAQFSPDGRYILSGWDDRGHMWRTCDGSLLWTTRTGLRYMRFTADGQNLISLGGKGDFTRVYSKKEWDIYMPDPQL